MGYDYDYYSYSGYNRILSWYRYGTRYETNSTSIYSDGWDASDGYQSNWKASSKVTNWLSPAGDGTTTWRESWSNYSDRSGSASGSSSWGPFLAPQPTINRYRYAEKTFLDSGSTSGIGPWAGDWWSSWWSNQRRVSIRTQPEFLTGADPDGWAQSYFWLNAWVWNNDEASYVPNSNVSVVGQTLDSQGRVLALLPNNATTDVTPSVTCGCTDYDFDVGASRAEVRSGSLIVSIIAGNSEWPGPRPAGMEQRLGYNFSNSQGVPTDDQIVFDVLMNTPVGSFGIGAINLLVKNATFGTKVYQIDTSAGNLANASIADREWLTLALLKRAVNPIPPQSFSRIQLDSWAMSSPWDYRLVNEFAVKAVVDQNRYRVTRTPHLRRRSDIGLTRLIMTGGVTVCVKYVGGQRVFVPITADQLNSVLPLASYLPNAAAVGNDLVYGGENGDPSLMHRTAGSAGLLLYSVEQAIIRKDPPPFFSEIWFFASGSGINSQTALSLNYKSWLGTGCTWPEAYTYKYNFDTGIYNRSAVNSQTPTPFTCFLKLQ